MSDRAAARATRDVEPGELAARLGISRTAAELYLDAEVLDLHLDSFIWRRIFGYDLLRRHGLGLLRGWFYSQVDLPRVREARLAGGVWIITTNPFRTRAGRRRALFENFARLSRELTAEGDVEVVASLGAYRRARERNAHAAFIGIQGGNALDFTLDDFDRPELAPLSLVTLVHMTRSRLGAPARPFQFGSQRLTAFGADYVRKLNERRIFVDLAHLSEPGFWDVLEVHDRTQPLTLSHSACQSVHRHFRNATDAQLKAVADTGGVIGIIFNAPYVGTSLWRGRLERVVDHVVHAVRVVGAEHVALGSDFDGAIVPPRDLASVLELPRLADALLRRGLSEADVRRVLGGSFLRALALLRP